MDESAADQNLSVPFIKMQGIGNDFVVVDASRCNIPDLPSFARYVCDRKFGVGSDGLLVVEPSEIADARMRMFNPDGTEDFCGNGLRCVVRYVAQEWLLSNLSIIYVEIETTAGLKSCTYYAGEPSSVRIELGNPSFAPEDVPISVDSLPIRGIELNLDDDVLTVIPLSTGSTHTVIFCDQLPNDDVFFLLSPQIENHPLFPDRTSIMWTTVVDESNIELRIWERGAGETLGCGTGASAAAVASIRCGFTRSEVNVKSKGGTLQVEWSEGSPVVLTGPAEYVYTGVVCLG